MRDAPDLTASIAELRQAIDHGRADRARLERAILAIGSRAQAVTELRETVHARLSDVHNRLDKLERAQEAATELDAAGYKRGQEHGYADGVRAAAKWLMGAGYPQRAASGLLRDLDVELLP